MKVRKIIPKPIMKMLRPIYCKIYNKLPRPWEPPTKYEAEVDFWENLLKGEGDKFQNIYYRVEMLAMAGESNDDFLKGKIVADFGCGPLGSLVWITSATLKMGIDVLVDQYADTFTENIISHGMVYVKSTEKVIPIPSDYVDVLFSMNAMDHVDIFPSMCREVRRVIKPGGEFIGSFNLEEPPTYCEPQCLNEDMIMANLLNYMEIQSYRIGKAGPPSNPRKYLLENNLSYQKGDHGILWVRARKRSSEYTPNIPVSD